MTKSQTTTRPTAQQADTQPIDPDAGRRARERRDQRAIAGWFASGMHSRARQRRRSPDE
jgi:hypothetical protein